MPTPKHKVKANIVQKLGRRKDKVLWINAKATPSRLQKGTTNCSTVNQDNGKKF